MPATAAEQLPIRYSKMQRLKAKCSYLRAKIADDGEAIRCHREGRPRLLVPPCGRTEMEFALAEMRRLEGLGRRVTFEQCIAELRRE